MTLWAADLLERFPGRFLTEIEAEMERLEGPEYPPDFFAHVCEAHAYRQAKQATEEAKTTEQRQALPKSRLWQLVDELNFEQFREAQAAAEQKAGHGGRI